MRFALVSLKYLLLLLIAGGACGVLVVSGTVLYLSPKLPNINELKEIQLQTPLRVYTADRKLMAEFGEKRRTPLVYDQIPEELIKAILAAEDDRFFEHNGIDVAGLTRAFLELLQGGRIKSGGSTITMQVAKNFFLSHEKKFIRKFNEILLALQIEKALTKDEILELYLNKIFLGNRAYGIAAAAEVYYGKDVSELNLAQMAMIAGLPKAPSRYNPLVNASRAMTRRNWIIHRMLSLGYIDKPEAIAAKDEPITASYHGQTTEFSAPYFAETVRQAMFEEYGDSIYRDGYSVYTTLDSKLQQAAEKAVQSGLIDYSERHGYRGAEQTLEKVEPDTNWTEQLEARKIIGPLHAALVVDVSDTTAKLRSWDNQEISLGLQAIEWARPYINENKRGKTPTRMTDTLAPGQVIRIRQRAPDDSDKDTSKKNDEKPKMYWQLSQLPKAQASLAAINAHDGAIVSMVGGFDFKQSKFNRATQAQRQAGSCFKPFVYGAALANGFTPASIINDAPIVYDDVSQGEAWRPRNAGDQFKGPIRLRQALYESRNLVSIRLLQDLGVKKVIKFAAAAGLDKSRIQPNLSIALGTAQFTTAEMAQAYSTIANGGYKVDPYFITEVTDSSGQLVFEAMPTQACGNDCEPGVPQAPQAIESQDQFILHSMLQDVIQQGTGRKARSLKRSDIAGKTGTTNDQRDAWFTGYHPQLATSVWVGFDQPDSLGRREYGGKAALPIWIDFMGVALKDLPETHFSVPEGIASVKIDPETGLRAMRNQTNGIFEYFKSADAPPEWDESNPAPPPSLNSESKTLESIF